MDFSKENFDLLLVENEYLKSLSLESLFLGLKCLVFYYYSRNKRIDAL